MKSKKSVFKFIQTVVYRCDRCETEMEDAGLTMNLFITETGAPTLMFTSTRLAFHFCGEPCFRDWKEVHQP